MDIVTHDFRFIPTPLPRRADFTAYLCRRLIICSENIETINVAALHERYGQTKSGIPYHYVINKDGQIDYCRPRYWQNDLTLDNRSYINNSILILMEGLKNDVFPAEQIDSLVLLAAFLLKQEGLFVEQIVAYSEIVSTIQIFPQWSDIIAQIRAKIGSTEPYKLLGGSAISTSIGIPTKVCVPIGITRLTELSVFLGVPEQILIEMNPQLATIVGLRHDLQLLAYIVGTQTPTVYSKGVGAAVATNRGVDGAYGSLTAAAVKAFQVRVGFISAAQTGTVSQATTEAIKTFAAANHPGVTNPYTEPSPSVTLRIGSSGNTVKWVQFWMAQFGYTLTSPAAPGGTNINTPASLTTLQATTDTVSAASRTVFDDSLAFLINTGARIVDTTVKDAVYENPVMKTANTDPDSKAVQASTLYGGKIRPDFYGNISLPGYKNATLQIDWRGGSSGKKPLNGVTSLTISFLVSPSSFDESRSNQRQVSKTSGGWFVQKGGRNPITLNLSGYMLDIKDKLERHDFIMKYKQYIEDRKSNLFEYENYYSVKLICEGREYYGYVDSIRTSKNAAQPFTYQYQIAFVALDDRYTFQAANALDSLSGVIAQAVETNNAQKLLSSKTYALLSGG